VSQANEPEATALVPMRITVHYDFASTICYVAHRVMQRLEPSLDELGIELDWAPIDLSRITGYPRGADVPDARRDHARFVGRDLGIAVDPPRIWWDSRVAGAAALVARQKGRDPGWRERIWTALFEERREAPDVADAVAWARDLALDLSDAELRSAQVELEGRTLAALDAQVTGVPTFMLGRWPVGGIQTDETMLQILGRYAAKAREGRLDP